MLIGIAFMTFIKVFPSGLSVFLTLISKVYYILDVNPLLNICYKEYISQIYTYIFVE